MAKKLSSAGITTNETIEAWHVTQSVDALTGDVGYDISISGSLDVTGSLNIAGLTEADVTYDKVLIMNSSTGNVQYTASDSFGGNIDTGSFVKTGSVDPLEPSTLNFEKGDGSVFQLTVETGSSAVLTQNLTSNQNVGGVDSGESWTTGTLIEEVLRDILISYIAPSVSGLSIGITIGDTDTTRDVGNGFTMDSVTFSATQDSPNGNYPFSSSISSSGAETGTWNDYFGDAALVGSNTKGFSFGSIAQSIDTTAGTITYTVKAKSQEPPYNTVSTSKSYYFRYRNYLCASATNIVDNATAQTVLGEEVGNQLDTNLAWTATCTSANEDGAKYTYIMYPASYGDINTIVMNGATTVTTAFVKQTDRTVTNAYGSTESYRIYKSTLPGAYADGVTLQIS